MKYAKFFRYVQDSPWYAHFLDPIIEELSWLPDGAKILDIGTGPGKLLELGKVQSDLQWTGVDTDASMLAEAQTRMLPRNAQLHQISPEKPLPFSDNIFDMITFCSILYLLPEPLRLLDEAWRVLKPGGEIVVLTPTGEDRITPAVIRQIGPHAHNWTFFMWRTMTSESGRTWANKRVLQQYSQQKHTIYCKQNHFHNLTVVETLMKPLSCPSLAHIWCDNILYQLV